ncbi:alpha/beta fold hydrolase [Cyanobium sp. FACHB-13342]|uniref:alpha/beta fold hydrolase n=1 Tax=Cyanobium sp. FACHB-13342 TaxID=2692793 RepID=UPI001680AFA8|nr:alpha/beta fold hydrolase [Cyanobium sp. FACHB-13342]MBD2423396.1 alpha/beta fold hydrolase [Cyanobium sp. FACHB-13342]
MTTASPDLLIDGPAEAAATLVLAHGAGAPMDSPFMAAMAGGLAQRGWRVVRFEFPYMAQSRLSGQRRAPDRLPRLLESFRAQVAQQAGAAPVVIGGKSLGGRVASLLVDELASAHGVRGCLCLGYPFHPPGKPDQLRTDHLAALATPTLIVQGERDSFGKRGDVEGYRLSAQIQLQWIASGDHSFKPTRSSGLSEADTWAAAVGHGDQFLRAVLQSG